MSEAAVTLVEPSKRRRIVKIASWIVGLVVLLALLHLAGIDVWGWISELWDTLTQISIVYILLGCVFQALQTTLTALGWYGILRYAYPGGVTYMPVLASYAAGVALNNFLPANIGTFATLIMFTAIIPAATFPGAIAAYLVQKIFFTIAGTFVYLYLFLSVPGSFDLSLGNIHDNPVTTIVIVGGGAFLLVLLGRIFWEQVKKLWEKAKQGGVILSRPKEYFTRAFLPSLLSWLCKLAVIGIFLAAFAIPVTFESIMWIVGSGSLANTVSFTPGSVGITLVAVIGNVPMLALPALTLAVIGTMSAIPVFWQLPGRFLAGAAAAGGVALINSIANLAGFGAPWMLGLIKTATGQLSPGLYIVAAVEICATLLILAFVPRFVKKGKVTA